MPVWLVTRYTDARFVLADSRFAKNYKQLRTVMELVMGEGKRPDFGDSVQAHMLNMDPPDHTRLRKLVMKAFTPREIETLRPRIEEITAELLDAMVGKSQVDLLEEFAFPLPIKVISELLGVAEERKEDFREWSNKAVSGNPELARQGVTAMAEYFAELVEQKRKHPGDDLLSGLVRTTDQDDQLSRDELIGMAFLLLVAGHETTVNLIANCVLSLLENPRQLAKLRGDLDLVPDAIEETLRFESPVATATVRYTTEAVSVGDTEIPADQIVFVALGSANRDGERFDESEAFDLTHSTKGHLAFGHGIHFCVGATLARLEGQIAVRRLLERFPDLALAAEPETLRWRVSNLMRGLEKLPVRLAG